MQEEVEGKAVTLLVSGARLSARVLKEAISRYLQAQKGQFRKLKTSGVEKKGRQSVKSLMKQGQGVVPMEVKGGGIRQLERIARKYGIDYSIKKCRGTEKPTYQIYFKSKDKDMMTQAFEEFAGKKVKAASRKASVIAKLNHFKESLKNSVREQVRYKERVR